MSPYTSDEELCRLADGLTDHSLPKEDWTHAAHFGAALWLLKTRGKATYDEMPGLIRAYNVSVGGVNSDTEGYHETITVASLRAAEAALDDAPPGTPLHETLARLLAGPYGKSAWLLDYWSRERLFSVEARKLWVDPDIAPLPL